MPCFPKPLRFTSATKAATEAAVAVGGVAIALTLGIMPTKGCHVNIGILASGIGIVVCVVCVCATIALQYTTRYAIRPKTEARALKEKSAYFARESSMVCSCVICSCVLQSCVKYYCHLNRTRKIECEVRWKKRATVKKKKSYCMQIWSVGVGILSYIQPLTPCPLFRQISPPSISPSPLTTHSRHATAHCKRKT